MLERERFYKELGSKLVKVSEQLEGEELLSLPLLKQIYASAFKWIKSVVA